MLENKCCVLDCEAEHDMVSGGQKYCLKHCPNEMCANMMKRLCKYCDIREKATHVCKDCRKMSCKKEWGIVRFLRKAIDTKFEYNSSRMLQGCSKKRPDVYFELPTHCVIVEIDENQHASYGDSCECARLNEIVNGIGGKPVVVIRFFMHTATDIRALLSCIRNAFECTVRKTNSTERTSCNSFAIHLHRMQHL